MSAGLDLKHLCFFEGREDMRLGFVETLASSGGAGGGGGLGFRGRSRTTSGRGGPRKSFQREWEEPRMGGELPEGGLQVRHRTVVQMGDLMAPNDPRDSERSVGSPRETLG